MQKIEAEIDKHNAAIQGLIVVGRTCLDSIKEMREAHAKDYEELRKAQTATEDKLNILIDTVDRIRRAHVGAVYDRASFVDQRKTGGHRPPLQKKNHDQ